MTSISWGAAWDEWMDAKVEPASGIQIVWAGSVSEHSGFTIAPQTDAPQISADEQRQL
ncbi:hypothetical protein [Allorhodopirellula heiligendammensis]|uniref:hypothetical protein n=1 Tax=Allorhodopirellula heiligendammensis TaxID=2714739 RepID=UPI00265E6592|nr:hypothetical protein [Allorhodopirellula heiligendammensis]